MLSSNDISTLLSEVKVSLKEQGIQVPDQELKGMLGFLVEVLKKKNDGFLTEEGRKLLDEISETCGIANFDLDKILNV